jgi:hypothetical protein
MLCLLWYCLLFCFFWFLHLESLFETNKQTNKQRAQLCEPIANSVCFVSCDLREEEELLTGLWSIIRQIVHIGRFCRNDKISSECWFSSFSFGDLHVARERERDLYKSCLFVRFINVFVCLRFVVCLACGCGLIDGEIITWGGSESVKPEK